MTMYHAAMIEKELPAASTEPLIFSRLAKGEQWTVISTVLGGLWKGQHV